MKKGRLLMAKRKVKTAKRNRMTVDELNAIKTSYEEPLKGKDYLKFIGLPGLIAGAFVTIQVYYPLVTLVAFLLGCLYGWLYLLPKTVKKNYERASLIERNKFLNSMTQVMSDESKTVQQGLDTVTLRIDGAFKDDLIRLQASLFGADTDKARHAFRIITKKYEDDIIFSQYMEQIETSLIEGNSNVETLKDIKEYHNQMKDKQEDFENLKGGHFSAMKVMFGMVCVLVIAVNFSFGFDSYYEAFARHWIGWATSAIYTSAITYTVLQFSKYMFDDSVTVMTK